MQILSRPPEVKVSFDPCIQASERHQVTCSRDSYEVFQQIYDSSTIHLYEEAKCLFLDRGNQIIGYRNLNRGSTSGTVVDIRLIFSIALSCNASGIILAHNHPSGRTKPSLQDDELTSNMKSVSDFMKIKFLDHLIITSECYYSYADEGMLT